MREVKKDSELILAAKKLGLDSDSAIDNLYKDTRKLCSNSEVVKHRSYLNDTMFQYPNVWKCALYVLVGMKAFEQNFPDISEDTTVCNGAYNRLDGMSSKGVVSKELILTFISDGPYAYGEKIIWFDLKKSEQLVKRLMNENNEIDFDTKYLFDFFDQMIEKIK